MMANRREGRYTIQSQISDTNLLSVTPKATSTIQRAGSYKEQGSSKEKIVRRASALPGTRNQSGNILTVEGLNAGHISALRTSWSRMGTKHQQELIRSVLTKLESRNSGVARSFNRRSLQEVSVPGAQLSSVSDHVTFMISLLNDLIESLNSQQGISTGSMQSYGAKHATLKIKYGFTGIAWEQLGEILVEKLTGMDVIRRNKDSMVAWRLLIAYITDQMRHGFDQECKMVVRRMPSCDQLRLEYNQFTTRPRSVSASVTGQRRSLEYA